MPRRLAYADRWVWNLTQSVEKYPCGTALTDDDELKLFSALLTGADLAYPEESHRLMWLMWQLLECASKPRPRLPDSVTINASGELEICDDMVVINVYEGCGCGCGGNDGTQQHIGGDGPGTVAFPDPGVVPANCYAQKATDYLLGRAKDFYKLLLDINRLGWDAVLGEVDEFVDAALLLTQIVTGRVDLNSVSEIGEATIDAAFADVNLRNNLIDAWEYQGNVSRGQLREWINKAPFIVQSVVPIRSWLEQWTYVSVIPNYNNRLAALAASCASGVDVPQPSVTVDPQVPIASLTDGTTEWRLYQLLDDTITRAETDNRVLSNPVGTITTVAGDIVALIGQVEFIDPIPVQSDGYRSPWMRILRSKAVAVSGDDGTASYGWVNLPAAADETDPNGWNRWTLTHNDTDQEVTELAATVAPADIFQNEVIVNIEGFNIGGDVGGPIDFNFAWNYMEVGATARFKAWVIVKTTV